MGGGRSCTATRAEQSSDGPHTWARARGRGRGPGTQKPASGSRGRPAFHHPRRPGSGQQSSRTQQGPGPRGTIWPGPERAGPQGAAQQPRSSLCRAGHSEEPPQASGWAVGGRTPHGPLSPPLLLLGHIFKFKGRTQRGEATLAPESTRKRLPGPQIWSKEETMRARCGWDLRCCGAPGTSHHRGDSGRPGCDCRRLAASPAQGVGQPGVRGIAPAGTAESGVSPARTDSLLPGGAPSSRPPGLSQT